jgi:transcriptional regulator with XRE-family HTH domain
METRMRTALALPIMATTAADRIAARILRKARGDRSQAEIAKALGHEQAWLSKIERGINRVPLVEFVKLSDVLGFDLQEAIQQIRKADMRRS